MQRVGVGRRGGDKAKSKDPTSRDAVAGRRDRDNTRLHGALRQGASCPGQGQVIRFGLKAYEFKPARSSVSIGMKLLEPKLCRSYRQPEFICEQNKASLDPQRIHCDKAGWP
jgi:hypothetical protein